MTQQHTNGDTSPSRVDLRDTFAAAALTGLLASNPYDQAMTYAEYANESYRMADAMLRESERTNHDAAPAAKAYPCESSVPRGNGGGCGGTDKPVTLPAVGTGNLSEAEIDALEFVVEEGRIASMDDYGVLRSLLVRVRPEWETADSVSTIAEGETDSSQPVERTPQTHATPGEGKVQGEGTTNMADILYEAAENLQNVQKTFDQWSRATASVLYRAARHIEILEDAP